jgi:hypothetical protein
MVDHGTCLPPNRLHPTTFIDQLLPNARLPTKEEASRVWVNLHSKIYHYAGHKTYGKTKTGAYMCERDTAAQGMRASKNEKPPG